MQIEILPVGQLKANCYLVYDSEGENEALIIDPGDDGDFLANRIEELKLKPKMILATHGHFDHIMAAEELALNYKVPFLAHKKDLAIIQRAEQSAKRFVGEFCGLKPRVTNFLKEGMSLKFGTKFLEVVETPGHTPGSVCFFLPSEKVLFTGDTLFAGGGWGRTDFPYSSPLKLAESIKKVFSFPKETLIYPGHEGTSDLSLEERFYRFI